MEVEQAFGLALRQFRNDCKLSQEKLAEICGLHRTYISLLERGIKSPSLSTIFRISHALHLKPYQLVKLTEQRLGSFINEDCT